jgi:hypothetical protein
MEIILYVKPRTEWSEGSQSRQTVFMVVIPVVLGTKNHCAGEGQQHFSSQSVSKTEAVLGSLFGPL